MSERTWLITGCSTGLGRVLAERVIARGERIIATARQVNTLAPLVAMAPDRVFAVTLDVTKPGDAAHAIAAGIDRFGGIDVLVNNAGYGLIGALEEFSEAQIRANIETNLIGPIHVIRAMLPHFRERKAGRILNISAIAGFMNEVGFSIYGGAKFALEGLSESLRGELAPLGIYVTLVLPGPTRTDFIGRSLQSAEKSLPEYAGTVGKFRELLGRINGKQTGDPVRCAEAMIAVVDADTPPMRLVLGKYATDKIKKKVAMVTAELETWSAIGVPTDYPSAR